MLPACRYTCDQDTPPESRFASGPRCGPEIPSFDLTDCQWLAVRDLTFDGQGKAVDAIKAGKDSQRGCHHIAILNNTILGAGTGSTWATRMAASRLCEGS